MEKFNMSDFNFQVHRPKVDFSNYRYYIRGVAKIGKTTLFRDIVMYLYNDPMKGLLISLGSELGYKTLDNLVAHHCSSWRDFENLVDYLVEHKDEVSFKILGIDTVDRLVEIAEKKVMDIHRSIKGEYPISIDAAMGGYAKGKAKARSLIETMISRLEGAGYGMFYIGHTKEKQVGEQTSDVVYEKITGSLEFKYDALFSDRADFIPMIAYESVVKDKKQIKQERYIYFRSTPLVDAGSRIEEKYFPEKVEFSAQNFVDTIVKALEESAGVSGKDADKIRKEEELEKNKEVKKFVEKIKEEKYGGENLTIEEYQAKLLELAKNLSDENKALKKDELKQAGFSTKFTEITNIDDLKKVHAILVA